MPRTRFSPGNGETGTKTRRIQTRHRNDAQTQEPPPLGTVPEAGRFWKCAGCAMLSHFFVGFLQVPNSASSRFLVYGALFPFLVSGVLFKVLGSWFVLPGYWPLVYGSRRSLSKLIARFHSLLFGFVSEICLVFEASEVNLRLLFEQFFFFAQLLRRGPPLFSMT